MMYVPSLAGVSLMEILQEGSFIKHEATINDDLPTETTEVDHGGK